MKSRVISYPDINSIKLRPDQLHVEHCDLSEALEEELELLRRKHSEVRHRESGEACQAGDAVTLSVHCPLPDAPGKYNRDSVGINLGKNFYDRAVEEAVIGRAVGETISTDAGKNSEWPVTVQILSAQHTAKRPLTDEDFQEEGRLNDVEIHNEEEYLAFLTQEIRAAENLDHFYDCILNDLSKELVEASTFEVDEKEFEAECKRWHMEVDDLPDLPPSDDEDGFIPYVQEMTGSDAETREELEEALLAHYDEAFKYNLILRDLAKDEPDPPREALDALLEEMRQDGFSQEDIAANDDYDLFVHTNKLEAGQAILLAIIERQLID